MKMILLIVTIIVLAAVAGTIIVGSKSFEGLVTKKPYEKGLDWDKTQRTKQESGWTVTFDEKSLHTGSSDLQIKIRDKNNTPLTGASVTLETGRPGSSAYDRSYSAVEAERGTYRVSLHFPEYGHWNMGITVTSGQKSVLFERKLYISKGDKKNE